MTTQYTSILKLALPVQGELSGTWGDVVNDNITSMVEEAVAGRAVINTWTTNSHVLTTADGTTSESRCAMLEFTDTGAALTGAATVVCPNASKLYVCKNNSGQQVTVKTAAGTGVAIPNGQTMFVFCDGTNVEQCETNFNSLSFNGYTLNFGGAVTTAGAFTTSGAYALTLTTTGATNVTLPTTGTLATLDGTETLTNKTLTAPTISSPTLTGSISATDLTISGNTTIGDASSDTLTVNSTITSNLIFTDNTYDIGAVGATRPRNLYLSGNATIGGTVTLSGGIDVTGALGVDGDFDVNTDKFTVASATGNTLVAGTLGVTGITTATGGLNVDTISEITASGGVTVDGVLLKDGGATLTGDLTVDTDTLYVDSANDRVGVNEATPLEALHVTTSDSGTTINKTVGSTSGPVFVLDNTDDTTNNLAAIQFASSGSSSTDVTATTGIYSINTGRGGTYSYGDLAFYTTNSGGTHTEAMRIDSSQRVLIGSTSSINGYYLQVAENSGYAGVSALRYTNDAFGAYLNLGKSRTTTIGGNTIVQDNDVVGYITFSPNDGTDLVSISSQIQGEIDGTPGANDVPGRLVFKTTADGAASSTERMRITSSGNVGIASGGDVDLDSTDIALQIGSGSYSNPTIQIRSSSSGTGQLWFGDNSGADAGRYDGFIQYNQTDRFMYFGTAQSNALRIDSDQRTIIGGYSHIPVINASVQASVVGGSADSGSGGLGVARFGGPPVIALASSPNTTVGSFTLTSNGTAMGYLYYGADDGTDIRTAGAYIGAVVDGTPGANDMPGRLVFATTADGASSSTERMRINNSGDVTIGNAANARARLEVYDSDVSAVYDAGDLSTWRVMQVRNNIESFTGTAAGIAFGGDGSGDTETAGIVGISDNSTGGIMQLAFITATGNNSLEAMRIDSSQRVIIGSGGSVPQKWWNSTSYGTLFGVENNNLTNANFYVTGGFIRNTADSEGPQIGLGKSRSTTTGGTTIVQSGDTIGLITAQGADGTNLVETTRIWSQIDGTPGANDMPGRLMFSTTSDGNQTPTERMRIDSTGRTFVGNLGYIGLATTNSVFEAHGGSVVFGSGDGSNQQGYRTFVKFLQVNNSSGLPTSGTLELAGMTAEFYCKITVVGVNPYAGSNAFTYINESTGYAGGNFSVISANEYGNGTGISFGTATLVNTSGALYSIRIPVTSSNVGYRFVVTAEIIGISPQDNPRFTYS